MGSFDGVHRGHQAVVAEALRLGRAAARATVLVTFEPHPAEVLRPASAPLRLTVGSERSEALAELGLDYVFVLRFDQAMSRWTPEEFVRRILVNRCQARQLVLGEDHGLGRGRSGDVSALQRLGTSLGYTVEVVAPVADGKGGAISSTSIRDAIARTDFAAAAAWLGRPYRVTGTVQAGDRRGRTIGVPTINLVPQSPRKLLPPDGVYAVRVEWGGGVADGMLYQGARPTVGDPRRWLEAHLFGFDGDLYGRVVRIEWVARIRDTQRFGSLGELKRQLAHDQRTAEALLGSRRSSPSTVV